MSNYILKATIPGRIYDIRLGGSKIGFVRLVDGEFLAVIKDQKATGATAGDAFRALVTILNRVAICGENDADKARAALAARNAEQARLNEQTRRDMQPLVDDLAKIGLHFGYRTKTRKVRI